MSSVARPIIKQIKDSRDALDFFEKVSLPKEDEKTQDIIMNFPNCFSYILFITSFKYGINIINIRLLIYLLLFIIFSFSILNSSSVNPTTSV